MNGEFLQDPFTIYKTYCGVKLHFTTLKYDYTKYINYKVSEKTFKKRNDIMFFYSMAQILQKSDNVPFFVSQFIDKVILSSTIILNLEALNTKLYLALLLNE